jgi:hypothetical protein
MGTLGCWVNRPVIVKEVWGVPSFTNENWIYWVVGVTSTVVFDVFMDQDPTFETTRIPEPIEFIVSEIDP